MPRGDLKLGVLRWMDLPQIEHLQRLHEKFGIRLDPHQSSRECTSQTESLALAAGLPFTIYPENVMRFVTGAVAKRGNRTARGRRYIKETILNDFCCMLQRLPQTRRLDPRKFANMFPRLFDKHEQSHMDKLFELSVDSIRTYLGVK